MSYTVTVLEGDGIGKEIVSATQRVLDATGVPITWEVMPSGEPAAEKYKTPVPDETIESIRRNKVAIKGPLTNMVAKGFPSPNITLRIKLGIIAAVKCAKSFEGVPSIAPGADLIVVREANEDTYAGAEQQVGPDAAVAFKFITRETSERVARYTMELARKLGRKKVAVAHKANVLKLTDGLFLNSAQKVAEQYPDIEFESVMIDHIVYKLVKRPLECDIILAPNVYGDILADLIAGVAGSLGLGYGMNIGSDVALFEPIHGTVPSRAGKNIINPLGEILSGALMLNHLGETKAAKAVEDAAAKVLKEGKVLTYDMGGTASTTEFTNAIINALA